MNEQITITKADGTSVNAYIICFIENKTTGVRYLYYTLNETSGEGANGTVKIYVAKINQNNPALDTPITEEEWGTLKGYMSDALKGNIDPNVTYLAPSLLVAPISVSEKAIAMPTNYDYINKQKGIYAQNIAIAEPAPQNEVKDTTPVTEETPEPIATEVQTPMSERALEPNIESSELTPTPVTPTEPEPISDLTPETTVPVTPETDSANDEDNQSSASSLTPIDIANIEKKYDEMIETLINLKNQELEAIKRYNATIELSQMHNEQHANYVQNEQTKELESTPTETAIPLENSITTPESQIEQTPETTAPVSDANLETNWFDMPAS